MLRSTESVEWCALATLHASFEAPNWVFADEIMTRFAMDDLPNPEVSRPCESALKDSKSDARDAAESMRTRSPIPTTSRSIFVRMRRDRR